MREIERARKREGEGEGEGASERGRESLKTILPYFWNRYSSYPHIRISLNCITLQAFLSNREMRQKQKQVKTSVFYFPVLGQWTVRENNSELFEISWKLQR